MAIRLAALERRVRWLTGYAGVITALLLIAAAVSRPGGHVLRVRGIIVEDSLGRERILIGAPIPPAANRVRTDTARVRRIWGPRFPDKYMTWYRDYRHGMTGMLVLNDSGFDRVAVGDSVPDPNIGRRIAPAAGMMINDRHGFERSGYGLLTVDGHDRIALGFDAARGEAMTLALRDSGALGLNVTDGHRSLFFGLPADTARTP